MKVFGTENVLKNLNKEIRAVQGRTEAGLKTAGLLVQRESQKKVPIDTGNLKASAYTQNKGAGVEVGFTADYAIYVHENEEAYHARGEAKFLEKALIENKSKILEIIQKKAKF